MNQKDQGSIFAPLLFIVSFGMFTTRPGMVALFSLLALCSALAIGEHDANARRLALIVGSNAAPAGKARLIRKRSR